VSGGYAAAGSQTNANPLNAGRILNAACWFESGPDWPQSECGTLIVPEDYTRPAGRKIELPFIIFRAYTPDKNTSPLLVAGGGGPGVSLGIAAADWGSAEHPLWTSWSASTVDTGRDLILIDNRGVGTANPRLDCNEIEAAAKSLLEKKLERDKLVRLIKTSYASCKQRLESQGIDLGQYQLINAAKDLEQLRLALGIEQLNIYGASYASRVALAYEKMYPGMTRAMILDGVIPQSIRIYEEEPRRNYEAIMRVIDKCNRSRQCYRQYGIDLDKRLADYLALLDVSPKKISIKLNNAKEPVAVKVTASMFFNSLYSAIYDPEMIRKIPGSLNNIFAGDIDDLTKFISDFYVDEISASVVDEGAYASYACYEEIPFVDFKLARSELMKYPFQHYSNTRVFDHMEAMCEVWDVPAAAAKLKQIYNIETPLLIYAGELDPVTPVEMARPVIENASTWWGKVWPDNSHEVIHFSECADRTAAVFLHAPKMNPFILACAGNRHGVISRQW
jgi:pimeloyl-ACP methyl ester carboxylesterase